MVDKFRNLLDGEGETDYERYMRTATLLSLQRRPEEVIHRDELLFQVVHQCTELLLKLACSDIKEAAHLLAEGKEDAAARLTGRAAESIRSGTELLEMLRHLNPADFQVIRTVLGTGSGLQSPGWRTVRKVSAELDRAFGLRVAQVGKGLPELYSSGVDTPLYRLAEAMIEWDERICLWRVRHFKLAARIIGQAGVGTRGMPVEELLKLIQRKLFPTLWAARDEVAEVGAIGIPVGETRGE